MKSAMGIRTRLTLAYTGVLLLILAGFSSAIYFYMNNRQMAYERAKLDDDYAMVADVLVNSGGDIYDVYHFSQDMMFKVEYLEGPPQVEGIEIPKEYNTDSWEAAGIKLGKGPDVADGYLQYTTADSRELIYKTGVIDQFKMRVSYAQDITSSSRSLHLLVILLLTLIPVALLVALVSGHLLARQALAPVDKLAIKAKEITAESLGERLPVENPNDEIGRLAIIFNDMLARLERSFGQLKAFTSDAAHELRTPLTSIRSRGEVALKAGDNEGRCCEAIGSILEETEYITKILDNLLLLSRGDSGAGQLKRSQLDISALIREVVKDLHVLAEEKQQDLQADAGEPLMVLADPTSVRQALYNVIHNAIKYTPVQGRIKVKVWPVSANRAAVTVEDSGPGIPADERNRVFDRFYRLDKARSRSEGGVGLGLAIAKWAVEANDGEICFIEPDGPGGVCRITLRRDPLDT